MVCATIGFDEDVEFEQPCHLMRQWAGCRRQRAWGDLSLAERLDYPDGGLVGVAAVATDIAGWKRIGPQVDASGCQDASKLKGVADFSMESVAYVRRQYGALTENATPVATLHAQPCEIWRLARQGRAQKR